jgi:hypothetical protein
VAATLLNVQSEVPNLKGYKKLLILNKSSENRGLYLQNTI